MVIIKQEYKLKSIKLGIIIAWRYNSLHVIISYLKLCNCCFFFFMKKTVLSIK